MIARVLVQIQMGGFQPLRLPVGDLKGIGQQRMRGFVSAEIVIFQQQMTKQAPIVGADFGGDKALAVHEELAPFN